MREYECMYILDPSVEEKDGKIEEIRKWMEDKGGVDDVDVWGNRKLAYPIKKKEEGYYVVVRFRSTPDGVQELKERLRMEPAILRFLIVRRK